MMNAEQILELARVRHVELERRARWNRLARQPRTTMRELESASITELAARILGR